MTGNTNMTPDSTGGLDGRSRFRRMRSRIQSEEVDRPTINSPQSVAPVRMKNLDKLMEIDHYIE